MAEPLCETIAGTVCDERFSYAQRCLLVFLLTWPGAERMHPAQIAQKMHKRRQSVARTLTELSGFDNLPGNLMLPKATSCCSKQPHVAQPHVPESNLMLQDGTSCSEGGSGEERTGTECASDEPHHKDSVVPSTSSTKATAEAEAPAATVPGFAATALAEIGYPTPASGSTDVVERGILRMPAMARTLETVLWETAKYKANQDERANGKYTPSGLGRWLSQTKVEEATDTKETIESRRQELWRIMGNSEPGKPDYVTAFAELNRIDRPPKERTA